MGWLRWGYSAHQLSFDYDQNSVHLGQQPLQVVLPPRRRFRFSPTAIVEGREQTHIAQRVEKNEEYELEREAQKHAFHAKLQNISCPLEREKQQVIFDFADPRSDLEFQEAWLKIDEIEQRESDQTYLSSHSDGVPTPERETDHPPLTALTLLSPHIKGQGQGALGYKGIGTKA